MTIAVEISDRLYDYTDEEKAALAVADFQVEYNLDDAAVIGLWNTPSAALRDELDRRIITAVDLNGSARRARETIPAEITLLVEDL